MKILKEMLPITHIIPMNASLEIILDVGELLLKGYKERYTIDFF